MNDPSAASDKPVDDSPEYRQREWLFERVGWGGMLATLVAALLGLFGCGPLAMATKSTADQKLTASYESILRYGCRSEVRLEIQSRGQDRVRISIDQAYLEGVNVTQTVPEAVTFEAGEDTVTYVFQLTPDENPQVVRLLIEPLRSGSTSGQIRLAGGPALTLSHFVYP